MDDARQYLSARLFLEKLRRSAKYLQGQEFRTLKGQALAGDLAGAEKGLRRLLEERMVYEDEQDGR